MTSPDSHNPQLPQVLRKARAQQSNPLGSDASSRAATPSLWTGKRKLLILLLAALTVTGMLYPVENAVVAPGKVIPSDRVQTVQHLEGGIVSAVHVREGQTVARDQALLEIDLGGNSLNLEQLTARHAATQAMQVRLNAESLGEPLKASDFEPGLEEKVLRAELGAFAARAMEHQGSLAAAQANLQQARADVAETQARISGLQTRLNLFQQEADIANQLAQEQLIGQLEVLDRQRALEQVRSELAATRQNLASTNAKVALAQAKLQETQGGFRSRASEELASVERDLHSLTQDLSRANTQRTRTVVLAPTDGIIKGLRSSGTGWVVKPGEAIMEIVPDKDEILIEARLSPSDRGYVHSGQDVKVKISAYDFLRYGSVPGKVTLVAADADRDQDVPDAPSYFRILASLDQPWVGRTDNRITTGMQADVDLLLGHEPFIWYLLRPVLRIQSEAFREP